MALKLRLIPPAPRALALVACITACSGDSPPTQTPTSTPPGAPMTPTQAPTPTAAPTASPTETAVQPFVAASVGCSMSHCDSALSDLVGMEAPSGPVAIRWHDQDAAGSNYGLGCSSNGSTVACSMGGNGKGGPYLKVYDAEGRGLWSSDALGFFSFASAPMIDDQGGVIAADTEQIIRYAPDGSILWQTATDGGIPISPIMTDDGTLVLAGLGGPVSAFDSVTGEALGSIKLNATWEGSPGAFNSRNTPCIIGNRVYVSTEFLPQGADPDSEDPENRPARLYAIDVDRDAPPGARLTEVWHYEFGARSGSSPLCLGGTVYFDGDRLEPGGPEDPHVFAIQDQGDTPMLRWKFSMPSYGFASAVSDPRGGLWAFGAFEPDLIRIDHNTGEELQRIDLDALVGERGDHVPLSAMSLASGDGGQPVLILTAAEVTSRESYLAAVDLSSETLSWKLRYGEDTAGWGAGQFPLALTDSGEPVVVFTTAANGIIGVAAR